MTRVTTGSRVLLGLGRRLRRFSFSCKVRGSVPNDLSQTSHCNIKGVSVSEVMRIDNMITQVKFY